MSDIDKKREKIPLLVLMGPTAIGKTELSLSLAQAFGAEIINGDSMQVYKGMNIGTAKLPVKDRRGIPHHLLDICEMEQSFSAQEFQRLSQQKISEIYQRGKLPFIVGGTGLYIESLIYGFSFANQKRDNAFREKMHAFVCQNGKAALHDRLYQVDKISANKLHPHDERRVMRALEIFHLSGKPMSQINQPFYTDRGSSLYQVCLIGLTMPRSLLYTRINERVDQMLAQGLVEEVSSLCQKLSHQTTAMQALGYKEIASYVQHEISLEEAVTLLKRNTRHFAKRQLSWFRHMKDVNWVEKDENTENKRFHNQIYDIIAGKFKRKLNMLIL